MANPRAVTARLRRALPLSASADLCSKELLAIEKVLDSFFKRPPAIGPAVQLMASSSDDVSRSDAFEGQVIA